jgi:ribosomal biogenesis protein LAS1
MYACRLVPWADWAEWHAVREGLWSADATQLTAALTRVETWRARGRVPLAVDMTACLLDAQRGDPNAHDDPSIPDTTEGTSAGRLARA